MHQHFRILRLSFLFSFILIIGITERKWENEKKTENCFNGYTSEKSRYNQLNRKQL